MSKNEQAPCDDEEVPLATVLMVTYNHAPFIAQAIESCLAQKTSFPFELVICDDASTDGTDDVVRRFADKHKNITYLRQPVNGRGANNYLDGLSHVRTRYVAFCEGDDYWTSEHKLEQQVRFLEANPDFTVACHRVEMRFEHRAADAQRQYIYKDCNSEDERIRQGVFHADEVIASYHFQTSSFVFRWRFTDGLPHWFRKWMMFDHALLMLHAVEGKIKYFDEPMSVWRRNDTGYSWLQNVDKGVFFQKEGYGWILHYEEMDKFFGGRFHLQIRERILLAIRGMIANCLETGDVDALRKILEDHQHWCLKLIKDNAGLFDAVRLALPDRLERVPPWSGRPADCHATPVRHLGGFREFDIASIPEHAESVWSHWVGDREHACFANPTAAVVAWLHARRVRRVWLPSIIPKVIEEELQRLWIGYQFYPAGGHFSPSAAFLGMVEPGDAVLTRAWMGAPLGGALRDALLERRGVLWIDDRSEALWPSPVVDADVTVYSPADVLGVPDGGILVGEGVQALSPSAVASQSSYARARRDFVLDRFEQPDSGAALVARERMVVVQHPLPGDAMSRLSADMLKRMPLPPLVTRGQANWRLLTMWLREWAWQPNEVDIGFAPFVFPILVPKSIPRVFIATALNREGILCTSYRFALNERYGGCLGEERELLDRLLCLPCDHRCDEDDIRRIASSVRKILAGDSSLGSAGTRFVP